MVTPGEFYNLIPVLTAEENKIGSCMLLNINREKIRKILKIPDTLYIDAIIALGYKNEQAIIEDMIESPQYYRDENEVLHVPKRTIKEILHLNGY